jgi:glycosyltransferase involved in cell wall biosynthesis
VALLSVIIPVYRVADYLADCLDSVLDQSFTDVEVIAVDDASDDGCGKILSWYADRDSRLHVVTHERNRGLGAARNTGLALATGEYVWFVDSDDWLAEGTLLAVADRLAQTCPDLLVARYARVYADGRVEAEPVSQEAGDRPAPETFTMREQSGLLSVLHIACNKIVRRRFLADLGLTFGPGWYEDVSFSLPLMLAADRVSLLDRHCYAYRQRASGNITHTVSERHFDVFLHWDRVFAFMDSRPGISPELRGLIFQRMIWHFLQVLGHPRRVPKARRREFFATMAARYRAHRPAGGHQVPTGRAGVKHRLVGHGAYRLFEALRVAHQARVEMLGRARRRVVGTVDGATAPKSTVAAALVPGVRDPAQPGALPAGSGQPSGRLPAGPGELPDPGELIVRRRSTQG